MKRKKKSDKEWIQDFKKYQKNINTLDDFIYFLNTGELKGELKNAKSK